MSGPTLQAILAVLSTGASIFILFAIGWGIPSQTGGPKLEIGFYLWLAAHALSTLALYFPGWKIGTNI